MWLKNDQFVTSIVFKGLEVLFSQNMHKVIHRFCGKHCPKKTIIPYSSCAIADIRAPLKLSTFYHERKARNF